MKFQLIIKTKILKIMFYLASELSDVVFIMLINVKMPTIVGISTFMSTINFMLSLVEHEKSFITSRPGSLEMWCHQSPHLRHQKGVVSWSRDFDCLLGHYQSCLGNVCDH